MHLIVLQKDGTKKVQYLGQWITDLEITSKNAQIILDAARARWKIENECFNSLKNHGYNMTHSYGHGSENLCFNFYNFILLAFTMHQIHQLTDKLFQELRSQYSRLGSLWEQMLGVISFFYFTSMEVLWEFMAQKKDYQPPPV